MRFGHLEVLQLLVAHNANLRARDHNGRTLLMRAARCGNIPAIDLLLQKGASRTQMFGRRLSVGLIQWRQDRA